MMQELRTRPAAPAGRPTAPRWSNRPLGWLLRSPFHWLVSSRLMLMAVRGRRTGRYYTFPVGYLQLPGVIYVLVGGYETKRWWRNLEDEGTPVALIVRRHVVDARATVLDRRATRQEFDTAFALYRARFPRVGADPSGVLMVRCALA